jgi:hypothetical protein
MTDEEYVKFFLNNEYYDLFEEEQVETFWLSVLDEVEKLLAKQ